MTCPRQAHLRYDAALPQRQNAKATWGSVVHLALKEYFDSLGDYDRALALFHRLWAHPDQIGLRPDYWPKMTSYAGLKTKFEEIFARLHAQDLFRTWTVVATEHPFLVRLGDHELNGIIDLIAIERSGTGKDILKVIDWKGSSNIPTQAELALNPQLTCYLYALSQRETWVGHDDNPKFPAIANGEWLWETVAKMVPHRAIWYALWNGKELDAGPRDQSDYERLNLVITEIERSAQAQIWIPNIGSACTWCDYTEQCGLAIPEAVARIGDQDDQNRWL